ncbi:MAG: nicotinate-nucleotide--dimethylbenzimidazole phosphoribosyltransferase, partial [Streptosporangiales bacterium]|nr:nicotinate-nucleotide--dimethylbenzimidazole phosphoribosyltransferase [Streptosporangiales bacterium]
HAGTRHAGTRHAATPPTTPDGLAADAILQAPVSILVTVDPTRGMPGTLGRHGRSGGASAHAASRAVANLWLAARAEGLGVGWVTFYDDRELVDELAVPAHQDLVAYLCLGHVPEPAARTEQVTTGWGERRPLSWAVHNERYGRRGLPGEEPMSLLSETVAAIAPPRTEARDEARRHHDRLTKPKGALGVLEEVAAKLAGLAGTVPPPMPDPASVAIFAADHGVHAQRVTAWPQEVTAQMVANFLTGGAVVNSFAAQVGADVAVVDVGVAADLAPAPGLLPRKVAHGTADMTVGPAMTREQAVRAMEVGIETARDLVAAGTRCLITGDMGIANTTASAALISCFTGRDPGATTGRGTGVDDAMHRRKVEVVRRALDVNRPDPADPIGVLAAVGGLEHAAIAGLLLGAAALRTPVLLDGVVSGAAALVAAGISPDVPAACVAGHRSSEPGHAAALERLGLRPMIDLELRLGEGTGALLALPLVQGAVRVLHEVATFDTAGVSTLPTDEGRRR